MQAQKRNEKLTVLPGFFTLSPVPPNGARENATFHVCLFFFLLFLQKIPHGFSEKIIGIPL